VSSGEGREGQKRRARLPRAVIGLGLVSLFTDLSSEAIFPLLPAFLAALGASNAFIGAVEGMAELIANFVKYASGVLADRRARLKPMVLSGYGLSTIVRPLMAFAAAPWHVLVIRGVDRIGKGVRTSPRDSMIASATDKSIRAWAYGFHRAMDHMGAALGTMLSVGILWALGAEMGKAPIGALRTVFLWAAVPGFFAMVALALTREPTKTVQAGAEAPAPVVGGPLPRPLKSGLVAIVLFAFANATDAFLLVKARDLGAAIILAPILWFTLHVVKASVGTFGGRLADRFGRRNALALGWFVYALTWGAIGFAGTLVALFALTATYGISHGLVEGAERALVVELAGPAPKGKVFGAYNMSVGASALIASTAFGAVWDRWGSVWAFGGSAVVALAAVAALLILVPAQIGGGSETAAA
jgi:MFS family permease